MLQFIAVLSLQDFNVNLFSILCYLLWYYRNRAIFEGVDTDDIIIHMTAATMLTDFCNARSWPERFPVSLSSKLWTKPTSKGLRIYFDDALSRLPAGGKGVFISDETGIFLHGASKFCMGINDPHVIEMLALRDALRLTYNLGLHSFTILDNSQVKILALLGETEEPSLCSAVLGEIKELLLSIVYLSFHWIRRSANIVAHDS